MKKMKKWVLLAVMGVLAAGVAQATYSLPGDNVTEIMNLDVGGVLYNVAFVYDSADDIWSGNPDFTTQADALAANMAINEALNAASPEVTTVGPTLSYFYKVPYAIDGDVVSYCLSKYDGSAQDWVHAFDSTVSASEDKPYAVFTAVVPEPATMALLGLGALLFRRKK